MSWWPVSVEGPMPSDYFTLSGDEKVAMTGVEAGGHGIKPGQHAARFSGGKLGILHGTYTYLLQNQDGQIENTHSISAGLDYPAIGPEHLLESINRAHYAYVVDEEAAWLQADFCSRGNHSGFGNSPCHCLRH